MKRNYGPVKVTTWKKVLAETETEVEEDVLPPNAPKGQPLSTVKAFAT